MPTESTTPAQPGTLKRLLAGHPFFEDWDDDGFKSLAGVCQLLDYSEGERVLEAGDLSPFSGFLLEGQLELTPTEGQPRILEAGDLDAGFPFANLRPSCYDVVSCSDSSILQIETSRLKPAHKQGEARLPTARCSGVNRRWIQFRARWLPRIDETPAFQKLALGQLSPKLSLVVLDQAKSQITELRSLLT